MLNKKNMPVQKRSIARTLARKLSNEEMKDVSGGTTSYKNCKADDCDVARV